MHKPSNMSSQRDYRNNLGEAGTRGGVWAGSLLVIPNLSPPHFHKNDPGAGVIELWARVGPTWHCSMPPHHPAGSTLWIQDLGRGRPGAVSRPHPEAPAYPTSSLCPLSSWTWKAPTRVLPDPEQLGTKPGPQEDPTTAGALGPSAPGIRGWSSCLCLYAGGWGLLQKLTLPLAETR